LYYTASGIVTPVGGRPVHRTTAYRCEQIISAINHSVASTWFSSLRLYYDARTNIHQILLPPVGGY